MSAETHGETVGGSPPKATLVPDTRVPAIEEPFRHVANEGRSRAGARKRSKRALYTKKGALSEPFVGARFRNGSCFARPPPAENRGPPVRWKPIRLARLFSKRKKGVGWSGEGRNIQEGGIKWPRDLVSFSWL